MKAIVQPTTGDITLSGVMGALADPVRVSIVRELAAHGELVCGTLDLGVSKATRSHHLRVLRESGFVEARVEAQKRVYSIRPEPFREVDEWLQPFRRFWEGRIDALERHLDRMAAARSNRKGKKR